MINHGKRVVRPNNTLRLFLNEFRGSPGLVNEFRGKVFKDGYVSPEEDMEILDIQLQQPMKLEV